MDKSPLSQIVHSEYINSYIMPRLRSGELEWYELVKANEDMERELRTLQIEAHEFVLDFADGLLGENKITLVREGTVNLSKDSLSIMLRDDMTDREEEIIQLSDEQLSFLPHEKGEQQAWFIPRKTYLVYASENHPDISFMRFRIKHQKSLAFKVADYMFGIRKGSLGVADYAAFRMVTKDETTCYDVLERMLSNPKVQMLPQFKDYIKHPKPSGYQGLHAHFKTPLGNVIEMQIRSTDMNQCAERGFASHSEYKLLQRRLREKYDYFGEYSRVVDQLKSIIPLRRQPMLIRV